MSIHTDRCTDMRMVMCMAIKGEDCSDPKTRIYSSQNIDDKAEDRSAKI